MNIEKKGIICGSIWVLISLKYAMSGESSCFVLWNEYLEILINNIFNFKDNKKISKEMKIKKFSIMERKRFQKK